MSDAHLLDQMAFIRELGKLKAVIRQSPLPDADRRENTAEHSWHVAMTALALAEHAPAETDINHAVKLLLIHDIVEIDAGDTYAFDEAGYTDKYQREAAAARRIFGLLPGNQGAAYVAMWEEFEQVITPEAKYANAIDQLMPLLHNVWTDGGSWLTHNPTYEKVAERTRERIGASGVTHLHEYTQNILQDALERGWLRRANSPEK